MTSILIIEPSATLRYGIKREVALPDAHVREMADCCEVITWLNQHSGTMTLPDAIVLGWPVLAGSGFRELAKRLCQGTCRRIPLLLVVQDNTVLNESCLLRRERVQIQLWSELHKTTQSLQSMLEAEQTLSACFENAAHRSIKILLVDDSRTVRAKYGELLKKSGFEVVLAASPGEAFVKAKQEHFDIAIIDYYMPQQTGAELCQRLKLHPATRDIDLAVLTGSYNDALVRAVLASGATECMFKNESMRLFLARVEALVRLCEQRRLINREKEQLNNILHSIGEGVYGVDAQGMIVFINPAALKLLGYEQERELLGRSAHELFHYADQSGNRVDPDHCFLQQAYLLGDELLQWVTVFWSAGGVAVPVECGVRPRIIDGQPVGAVVAFRDIAERLLFEEELKWQINHDHLTKLLNRQYLERALEQEVYRLKRTKETSAVLFIDLDRFKQVNDLAGHAAGDQLLIQVSSRLQEQVRQSDLIARVAGDEFVVVLYNVNLEQASRLAEKMRLILDETVFNFGAHTFDITGSVGMTMIDGRVASIERVLANADAACHIAKQQGRNMIHLFDERRDVSAYDEKKQGWIRRLNQALEKQLFMLSFDPVFRREDLSLDSRGKPLNRQTPRMIDGIQELDTQLYLVNVRLSDGGELLHAEAFLPAAERFELIARIDLHLLQRIIELLALPCAENPVSFVYPLCEQTLLDEAFLPTLEQLLASAGADSAQLLFSLVEGQVGTHSTEVRRRLSQLHDLGCGIILEGQHQGYSSFTQFKHAPADYISINHNFVEGLPTDPIDQAVVRAIVDVSHAQNRKTLARQVNSPEICSLLVELKVDFLQGTFLGSSLPEADFTSLQRQQGQTTI